MASRKTQSMKLINFDIENDNIAIRYNGQYLDLHNCYEFRAFQFDNISRTFSLTWTRSLEEWSNEERCGFRLLFKQVTYLKVRERDGDLPYTEDACLNFIGFAGQDMRSDFDSFKPNEFMFDIDDININFEGGQAIKINSEVVEFEDINKEIIYVSLIGEGTLVRRPVWAERIDKYTYKICANEDFDRSDETLEFDAGEIVICQKQKLSGRLILVATGIRR